jgi:GNAT superfamily N-acetyltransferase
VNFGFSELELDRLEEASALMHRAFLRYNAEGCTDESIRVFKNLTSVETFREFLEAREKIEKFFNMWVCIDKDSNEIIGALSAYYDRLDNLFVDERYHKCGIAKRLFEMMLEYFNPAIINVAASLYAAPFYRKIGFADEREEVINKGMKVIMMTYRHEGGEHSKYLELFLLLDRVREKYGEEKVQHSCKT